jgi:hypothetical protein
VTFLEGAGLEVGVGVAIGMLAGTTGTHGSARGRMTLLAGVIGLVVGFVLAGPADIATFWGALFGLAGAVIACIVISDVVFGAGRREGSRAGAIGFLVSIAALVVVALAVIVPVLIILVLILLAWIGIARHRRAQRKHAGLRVLR